MTAVCDTTREHIGCFKHRVVTLVTDKLVVIFGASLSKLGVEFCKRQDQRIIFNMKISGIHIL